MAFLGYLFFASVFSVAVGVIVSTVAPRLEYILALLFGTEAAMAPVPVAQRRRVRQLSPSSLRSELQLFRAAA